MLEVAAPNLAVTIGEAQMEVHALGGDGSLQGDDFQLTAEHRGLIASGAGKGCFAEVADNAQDKTFGLLFLGQRLKAFAKVGTRTQVNRFGLHAVQGCTQAPIFSLGTH